MSKPFRDSSPGAGRDAAPIPPAPVAGQIEEAAKDRGETTAGWRRAGRIAIAEGEGAAEVTPEELAFDVRMALAKDPATKGMDELAMRLLADRIARSLAQARLLFVRKPPPPLHSAGFGPETAARDEPGPARQGPRGRQGT